jgi:hypothetical protein
MELNRREILGILGSGAGASLSGCLSSSGSPSEEPQPGGPQADYKRAVNNGEGNTYVDVEISTWFSCDGASPDNYDGSLEIGIIAEGEEVQTDSINVDYEDCMVEQEILRTYQLEEEYDDVLVDLEFESV